MDAPGKSWQQSAMADAKKGRGCFFYGCISLIILAILVIVGIYFGARAGIKFMRDNYTATKPVAVAPNSLSPADGARVTQRVEDFKKSLQAGNATAPLELTGEELDYLFRNSPSNELKDHADLTITNDRVRAHLSIPLDMYGPTFFGRFFNGEADVGLYVTNGAIGFQILGATVNGKAVPAKALSTVSQNMEWRPKTNDSASAAITNLQSVHIKDGKVILIPKSRQ